MPSVTVTHRKDTFVQKAHPNPLCLFACPQTGPGCRLHRASCERAGVKGSLMPANGQPVLPRRALLLASQPRPLLRAVPITRPHQDQQYSHRLITDSQTDRCTDTG